MRFVHFTSKTFFKAILVITKVTGCHCCSYSSIDLRLEPLAGFHLVLAEFLGLFYEFREHIPTLTKSRNCAFVFNLFCLEHERDMFFYTFVISHNCHNYQHVLSDLLGTTFLVLTTTAKKNCHCCFSVELKSCCPVLTVAVRFFVSYRSMSIIFIMLFVTTNGI